MAEPRAQRGYRRGAQGTARLCLRRSAPQSLFGTLAQARRRLSRLERASVSPRACALGRRGRARKDRNPVAGAQTPRRPPARFGGNAGEVPRQAEPLHELTGRIAARRGSPREYVPAGALTLAALRQVLPVAAWIPRRRAGLGAHHDRLHEQLQQVRETEGSGARLGMTILVTGGAGFIGSNFVLDWFAQGADPVINLDKLTYAGNPANLLPLKDNPAHVFVHGDICDRELVRRLLERHTPRAIVHFAAESHVDRSIHGPAEFVQTNILGTFALLEETRVWLEKQAPSRREDFRFLHVSTDEVFGSLGPHDPPFTESAPFAPNSPYAASKAAADHLVRAYGHTYGLPTLTVNCSNNYGPYQFPEKLIPLMILNAITHKPLPVYDECGNLPHWLNVQNHCTAIRHALNQQPLAYVDALTVDRQ